MTVSFSPVGCGDAAVWQYRDSGVRNVIIVFLWDKE